ncbi:mCG144573, partial [Mus musculus]
VYMVHVHTYLQVKDPHQKMLKLSKRPGVGAHTYDPSAPQRQRPADLSSCLARAAQQDIVKVKGDQKRGSNPLELELQVALYIVGLEPGPSGKQQVILAVESLRFSFLFL